jgi:hypothetical protein
MQMKCRSDEMNRDIREKEEMSGKKWAQTYT